MFLCQLVGVCAISSTDRYKTPDHGRRVEAQRACGDVGSVNAFIVVFWRHSSELDAVSRYVCWVSVICDESIEKVKEGSTGEDALHGRSARSALARSVTQPSRDS